MHIIHILQFVAPSLLRIAVGLLAFFQNRLIDSTRTALFVEINSFEPTRSSLRNKAQSSNVTHFGFAKLEFCVAILILYRLQITE